MKKLLITIMALGLFAPFAHADIGFVQSVSTAAVSNVSQVAPSINTSAPNAIILMVISISSGRNITVGDNQGGTYALATTSTVGTGPTTAWMFYRTSIAGGALIASSTVSGSATVSRIIVHEYSGVAYSNPLDSFIASSTPVANVLTNTGLLTTRGQKELFVILNSYQVLPVNTYLNGFTQRESGSRGTSGDQIMASTTASGFISLASNANWNIIMAAFLPQPVVSGRSFWAGMSFRAGMSFW